MSNNIPQAMRSLEKNKVIRNLRTFIEKGAPGLREHQGEMFVAAENFLRLPINAGYAQTGNPQTQLKGNKKGDYFEIVSATGSGKTRTFGTMAKVADVPTLIITPRNLLNKDTKKEFVRDIGIPENEIAVYDSKQPKSQRKRVLEGNPPPKYVITTYQSLPSLIKRHELDVSNPIDVHYRPLIILDEVHEAQGPEASQIINRLKKDVMVVGFTATDAGASQTLFDGQPPVYHLPLKEAIKRDVLCQKVRTGVVDVDVNESWLDEFKNNPQNRDFRKSTLSKFARNKTVVEGLIKFHLNEVDPELGALHRLPTVAYIEGVTAAEEAANDYNDEAKRLGIKSRAAFVSGEMGEGQYGPILEQFKKGEIQFVFNDNLLGMGFDAHDATVCHSLKPSNLPHVAEQQLGRVVRKSNPDYFDKYGINKCALAVNWRPKGTNPFLYAQVLGQAELHSDKYAWDWGVGGGGESKERPYMPDGIEVHLDYTDLQTVIARANQEREEEYAKVPLKDDWASAPDMALVYIGGPTKLLSILESFRQEKIDSFIKQGMPPIEATEIVEREWAGNRTSFAKESLCASPATLAELESQGILRRKELKAPAKADWSSNSDAEKIYAGGSLKIRSIFEGFRAKKIDEFVTAGMPLDEAAELVEQEWIGIRSSSIKESICASPAAINEMETAGELLRKEYKALPKNDWVSAADADKDFLGGFRGFKTMFEAFREEKIGFFITQGMKINEATEIVERDWAGLRSSGPKESLCLSPQAFDELKVTNNLRSKESKTPPKGDWSSQVDFMQDYIGSSDKFVALLENFRDEKIGTFVAAGMPLEEATVLVEREWVGKRNSGSSEGICGSPATKAELVATGKIFSKQTQAPPKADWLSTVDTKRIYVGSDVKFKPMFEVYRENKIAEFVTAGMPLEEATKVVDSDWVGIRTSVMGNQSNCISPRAAAEMESQGKLQRRTISQSPDEIGPLASGSHTDKIKARSFEPDSPDLKRTGRTRDKK